jgi:hypothetical protein
MKAENKTWAQIGVVVGAPKEEVCDRFKELQKAEGESSGGKIEEKKGDKKDDKDITAEVGASKDIQARWKEVESGGGGGAAQELNNAGSGGDGGAGPVEYDAGGMDFSGLFADDNTGSGGDGGAAPVDYAAPVEYDTGGMDFSTLFTDENWGNTGGSGWGPPKEVAQETDAKKNDGGGCGKGEDKSKKKEVSMQKNNDYTDDFFNPSYYSVQHERQGRLKADGIWTNHDVKVLEMLESQYTEHKWMHIQAAFYNWTGRMVDGELIKQKFADDGAV